MQPGEITEQPATGFQVASVHSIALSAMTAFPSPQLRNQPYAEPMLTQNILRSAISVFNKRGDLSVRTRDLLCPLRRIFAKLLRPHAVLCSAHEGWRRHLTPAGLGALIGANVVPPGAGAGIGASVASPAGIAGNGCVNVRFEVVGVPVKVGPLKGSS